MSIISQFLSKYKTILLTILVTLAVAGYGVHLYTQNISLKAQLVASEQNIKALNDTIVVVKDNAGKEESNKLAFITSQASDLKRLNDSLYKTVQQIKGKVNTIEVIKTEIKHDTVTKLISVVDTSNDSIKISFKHDTVYSFGNFRNIEGNSIFDKKTGISSTFLIKDDIGVKLTTGIKDMDKGKPVIFVKSDYPGFTITSLDGAVINPNLFQKKKTLFDRFSFGVNLSYSPLSYDLTSKNFGFKNQITLGGGIGFKIF